jgi:uncharacterized protein (TIGR00369 family)
LTAEPVEAAVDQDRRRDHFLATLGLRDAEVEGVELAMEIPTRPDLANMRGALQGGLIATLIDVVAGRLAYRGVERGSSVATTDLNIHYLAPVVDGPARAQARVLRRGRRMIVLSVDVYDVATGQLAAASTITFAVVGMPKKEDVE